MEALDKREKRREKSVVKSIGGSPGKNVKGRPKENRETKTPVTLMFLPSIYNEMKNAAHEEHKSVSELLVYCFNKYKTK